MNVKEVQGSIKNAVNIDLVLEVGSEVVRQFCCRSKRYKKTDFVLKTRDIFSKGVVHLSGALTMSNEGDFCFLCLSTEYVVNDSRDVISTHLFPVEVPELFLVFVWVQVQVLPTVGVSS